VWAEECRRQRGQSGSSGLGEEEKEASVNESFRWFGDKLEVRDVQEFVTWEEKISDWEGKGKS